ncbi:hypothetical protein [Streptomyces sp. NRRL F-2664]|uniref:hypothetical protein n=1 Tax=Streptomyces sp. NRRL F-2664 TaxID=1463842 RepID=UPI000691BAEB|nr:hypothetical protein [Streptomyces sp. NRRL F-2664]
MAMRLPGSENHREKRERRYGGVLAVVATVLMLAACDPSAGGAVAPSASTSTALTASATPPAASVTPTPSASATPSAPTTAPPTTARPTAPPPAATEPAAAPPAPARTRTTAPAPQPTQAKNTDCYPLSNAGNCYKAGQICRKADIGTSGRDAGGRAIHCRQDSGVGQRWGY